MLAGEFVSIMPPGTREHLNKHSLTKPYIFVNLAPMFPSHILIHKESSLDAHFTQLTESLIKTKSFSFRQLKKFYFIIQIIFSMYLMKSTYHRSRSRPRPRSHSRSSERSSHRRTRSRSRDRERRKGRDKEKREKEKDKGKDKELHNIKRG